MKPAEPLVRTRTVVGYTPENRYRILSVDDEPGGLSTR